MISQIEKGNAMPSFEIISKLAERLNCSITFKRPRKPFLFLPPFLLNW
ncbi:helix-turn-helix domain-containing protein [Paenibacillus sp. CMM36]